MVLDLTRRARPVGRTILAAALLGAAVGCVGGPDEAQVHNRQMDWLDRQCRQTDAAVGTGAVVAARSQAPAEIVPPKDLPAPPVGGRADNGTAGIVLPPDVATPSALPKFPAERPATPETVKAATASEPSFPVKLQGESQVRIVATIGTTPIYEREVREAVYQRLPELVNLTNGERRAKEQSMFKEELRKIIERELVLDELFALLNSKKQSATLNQLKDQAAREADSRLKDIQKRAGIPSEAEMRSFLHNQGLTLAGVRRHFERSFMMQAFLGERLKPKINNISLADIKDYYAEHGDEFMVQDKVKWQDLFVRSDRFNSPGDCKKYVDWLLDRVRHGEDFGKLITQYDMGDSKSREGMGFGEERGKILPQEVEPTVFTLKAGQVSYVEFEHGYHIVRVADRTYAGKRPFDEEVQTEIRRKLQGQVSDREFRKVVESLWRRSQPQILVD